MRYAMLTDAFRRLFPDIEGIDAGAPDVRELPGIRAASALPFTMKDRVCPACVSGVSLSQPPDVSVLSDGAGRVLLLQTAAVFADTEGYKLPGIEEPENFIHPGQLQNFLGALPGLPGAAES